jgi:hypothetical protein
MEETRKIRIGDIPGAESSFAPFGRRKKEIVMSDYALIRWLAILSKGACTVSVYSRVICAVLAFVVWDALNANQTSKDERAFERELFSRQLSEMERQAEHKRLLEMIEALKNYRDLSLPADPDEGY